MIILMILSLFCWGYLAYLNAILPFKNGISYLKRGGGDSGGDAPTPPTYDQSFPAWAKGLPQEQIDLYRQIANNQIQQPAQYQQASDIYSKLANYQPSQFQYPMADIQKALQAQQDLQYQQYQKQINPILASQGQYDSSYRTNLNSDFLKGQQAQNYGTTANLLTNQANQNYDLSKWLPQIQGQAAQGLQGVGTAQANLQNLNNQGLNTSAAGLGNVFGQGVTLGNNEYQSAQAQYQAALNQYNQQQQSNSNMFGALGTIGGAGLGALFAAPTGGLSLAGGAALGGLAGGTASTLFGGSGSSISPSSALSIAGGTGGFDLSSLFNSGSSLNPASSQFTSTLYNPQWANSFNPSGASSAFGLY